MKTLQVRNLPKSAQAGFTIIELIVVILLLGILTATALPRFLDVTDDAHAAVVDAVRGGLLTGNALFRAQFVAGGEDVSSQISQFGNNYPNASGYPIGSADTTLQESADCADVYRGLLQEGRPSFTAIAASGAVTSADLLSAAGSDFMIKANSGVCNFAYVAQYTSTADGTIPVLLYGGSGAIVQSAL